MIAISYFVVSILCFVAATWCFVRSSKDAVRQNASAGNAERLAKTALVLSFVAVCALVGGISMYSNRFGFLTIVSVIPAFIIGLFPVRNESN